MNMFLSILGVVGGRAYQVYYSASIARQQVSAFSMCTAADLGL